METQTEFQGGEPSKRNRFFEYVKENKRKCILMASAVIAIALVAIFLFVKKDVGDLGALFKSSPSNVSFDIQPEINGPAGVDVNSAFALKSSQELSEKEILGLVKFSPETKFSVSKKSVAKGSNVAYAAESDGKEQLAYSYELKTEKVLDEGKVYQVAIDNTKIASRSYSWAFQTKMPFKVVATTPTKHATSVPLNSGIEILFNGDKIENFENNFNISPAAKGKFMNSGRKMIFVPDGLEKATVYTVTIKKDVSNERTKETLSADFVFSFETANDDGNNDSFDFYNDFADIATNRVPYLEVSSELDNVNVEVFQFGDDKSFLDSYTSSRDWSLGWTQYSRYQNNKDFAQGQKKITNFSSSVKKSDYGLYLIFPEKMTEGYYLVKATKDKESAYAWMQITPVAHYYSFTHEDGLAWLYDFPSRKPLDGVDVSYVSGKDVQSIGKTNGDGTIKFKVPASLYQENEDSTAPQFLKISQNGHGDAFVRLEGKASLGNPYWSYLSTDRYLFRPSDTVRYWGVAKGRLADLRQKEVTVGIYDGWGYKFLDPSSKPIVSQKVMVSQFDTMNGELSFKGLAAGTYALTVSFGDQIISTQSIEVREHENPTYSIAVTPSKNAIFAGEEVKFDVVAKYFEGTPVSNLRLKYETSGLPDNSNKGEITLNEKGEGTVNIPTRYYDNISSEDNRWFSYPTDMTIEFTPVLAEESDIWGTGGVWVFGPKIMLQSSLEKSENDQKTILIKANSINPKSKSLDEYGISQNDYVSGPVANLEVRAKLIETVYEKIPDGEDYDFIQKVSVPRYRYEQHQNTVEEFSGKTDANGEWLLAKQIAEKENYSYDLEVFAKDADGKEAKSSIGLTYFSSPQKEFEYLGISPENSKEDGYDFGDKVKFSANLTGGQGPAETRLLWFRFQNSIQKYAVADKMKFEDVVDESASPSAEYTAVLFGENGFVEASSRTIDINKKTKNLDIEMKAEKAEYRPKETAKISIDVADANKKPVEAQLNVSVIDKALLENTFDWQANILDTLYARLWTPIMSGYSKYVPAGFAGGMGGCFAKGTGITMGDGKEKAIEDVHIGDVVQTFSDDKLHEKRNAVVQGTSTHFVDATYLINNSMRVTGEHRIYVNGQWKYAGEVEIGDQLVDENGNAVAVFSIEKESGINIPVYNIIVGQYHTYFADGFYVHNAGKDGGSRLDFVELATYQNMSSDKNGKASVEFKLPDNITSWVVRAVAYGNEKLLGGNASIELPTTLPFFADVSIGSNYIAGDRPTVKVRFRGKDYKANQETQITLQSAELGLNKSISTKDAFVEFPLDALNQGAYKLNVAIKQGASSDVVEKTITVAGNRFSRTETKKGEVKNGPNELRGSLDGFTQLTFVDKGLGEFYQSLTSHRNEEGMRLDQVVARNVAQKSLNTYFNENVAVDDINFGPFMAEDGGLSLLARSGSDLELTAKIADLARENVPKEKLITYFTQILSDGSTDIHGAARVLYGMASLGEPVLVDIQNLENQEELTKQDFIFLALGQANLGDNEGARKIFNSMVKDSLKQSADSSTFFSDDTLSEDEQIKSTALLGALLAKIGEQEKAQSIWEYLQNNHPKKDLDIIEEELMIAKSISGSKPEDAKFSYKTNARSEDVTLKKGETFSISLSSDEYGSLSFSNVSGKIMMLAAYQTNDLDIKKDDTVQIERNYFVDGKNSNVVKESDLVEVRLKPKFSAGAPDGEYQIADFLPSGFVPATRTVQTEVEPKNQNCQWYPDIVDQHAIYFRLTKDPELQKCKDLTIKYYARISTKGTFVADPSLIQSLYVPTVLNISAKNSLQIQ